MPRRTAEAAATTKSGARKTVTRRTKQAEPILLTWDHIAERAYYIHLETGGGDPLEDWLRAERELAAA
jgi:hypothetical protein